ncbi:MAG: LamG-like jellyroll fold domain-containing protein, partial [Terracidiphilus sp.]
IQGSNPVRIGGDPIGDQQFLDGKIDDVRIYNRALSSNEIAELYVYESTNGPSFTATAAPDVTNGFVVGATLSDGGNGYTNTPSVRIIGGGGNGAQAEAVVSNGVVIAIDILDAGSGYTNTPIVVIDPPFIANPVLDGSPMSFLTFSNLTLGGVYQLQEAAAWYWTNQPVSFTATNSADERRFRLRHQPARHHYWRWWHECRGGFPNLRRCGDEHQHHQCRHRLYQHTDG